jgi:adenylate cyclase
MKKIKWTWLGWDVLPRHWLRSLFIFAVFLFGVLHSTYLLRLGALDRTDEIVNDYRWLSVMPSDLPAKAGMFSYTSTGVKQRYAGAFTQLKSVSQWLDTQVHIAPDFAMSYELLSLCFCLSIFLFTSWRLSNLATLVLSMSMGLLLVLLNFQLHWRYSWGLPLASAVALCLAAWAAAFFDLLIERARQRLAKALGAYVPPELVAKMLADPRHFSTVARMQDMTVMFCDLRNFTHFSENMEPLQVQLFLSQLLGRFSEIIQNNRGTVDKYMGDCVMAFWGAPHDVSNHAEMALRTVLQIHAEVDKINLRRHASGAAQIQVSIGVNTGQMCVGDMGSEARRSYTVIGDVVNTAARLQDLAESLQVTALVGHATQKLLPQWAWREFAGVQLRGKRQPESIYSPVL